MSRPADWIISFKSTIDNTFTASLAKLKALFDDNPRWIEEEKERLRQELEAKEREAEVAEAALTMTKLSRVATGAVVKKPRGRPKKEKLKSQLAIVTQPPSQPESETETEASQNENLPPLEANVMPVAVESKSPAPIEDKKESIPVAKRPRGRPRKNIIDSPISKALAGSDISSLSASAETMPVLSMEEVEPLEAHEPILASLPPVEPVYILAKPELLSEMPTGPRLSLPGKSQLTPAKATVELEIANPPGSHFIPRMAIRSTPRRSVAPSHVITETVPVKEPTPKIESWTSQFLKNAPPKSPTPTKSSASRSPAKARREAPKPAPEPAIEPQRIVEEAKLPVAKANPALAHLQAEAAPAVESPLTRARRIDSQNTWREQQLSKFFVSKTEVLKNAMDTLKVVKAEERSSKMIVERRQSTVQEVESDPVIAVEKPASPKKPQTPVKTKVEAPPIALPKPNIPFSPLRTEGAYQDIFKVASPLKTKKDTLVFTSGPASPNFLGSFEAPPLDNTEIPDELAFPEVPQPATTEAVESTVPAKREPSMIPPGLSEEERIKRQRLKERQQQAIEKRNAQIRKAQEARQKQEEMFNPKPRPPMPLTKVAGMHTSNPHKTPAAAQGKGSSISGLHKTAIFNASKSNLSMAGGDRPDFKTPAAKVKSPASIKMAEKVVSSPVLPEIPSDDEEYLRRAGDARQRPDWAVTPALKAALLDQQNYPTDKIFDKIQPVRLEDIFKNKTFKRGRNSTIPFM